MLVHKAARHLVLAQARQAMRILQQAGYAASAAEIGLTADCLEFAAGDQGETADEVMDPLGKSFVVRVVAHGEVRLEKRVSAALFSFYRHGATDLSETGRDDVQEANAAAARSLWTTSIPRAEPTLTDAQIYALLAIVEAPALAAAFALAAATFAVGTQTYVYSKRAILAAWASDACAVEASPALRSSARGSPG